jgi:hypothetical protein
MSASEIGSPPSSQRLAAASVRAILTGRTGIPARKQATTTVAVTLLNIDGKPVVVEIGAPEYVRDLFGKKRYEFLAARTTRRLNGR